MRSVGLFPILFVCLTVSACSEESSDRLASSPAQPDTLPIALPPVDLHASDSVFVSEPSALTVFRDHYLVADAGSSSILVFRRDGGLERRVGRRGKGPGEFIAPAAMIQADDSTLAVVDAALQRITLFGPDFSPRGTLPAPGPAMSVAAANDAFLLGAQEIVSRTSVARVRRADSTVERMGTLPRALVDHAQLAASYPFSMVTATPRGVVVGFMGSDWIHRLNASGAPVDSVRPTSRLRRGVPADLVQRLEKSTAPANEAASTSLLAALAPLSGGGVGMIHVDYVIDGPSVSGKAYFSSLTDDLKDDCRDIVIPLAKDTRPMFAFHGDTLFVVQNAILEAQRVETRVTGFRLDRCVKH